MVVDPNALTFIDHGRSKMKMLTDKDGKPTGFIYNVEYELVADEDILIMQAQFKKGVPMKVTGLLAEAILKRTDKVRVIDKQKEKELSEKEAMQKQIEDLTKVVSNLASKSTIESAKTKKLKDD